MCILDQFGSVAKGKRGASLQSAEEAKLKLLYKLPIAFKEAVEDTAALSKAK